MTLEQLIEELKQIHAMHPNADVRVSASIDNDGALKVEPTSIRYNHLTFAAVINCD